MKKEVKITVRILKLSISFLLFITTFSLYFLGSRYNRLLKLKNIEESSSVNFAYVMDYCSTAVNKIDYKLPLYVEDLNNCLVKISNLKNTTDEPIVTNELDGIYSYYELEKNIYLVSQSEDLQYNYTDENLINLKTAYSNLPSEYQDKIKEKYDEFVLNMESLLNIKKDVFNMFINYESKNLKQDINREKYNSILKRVNEFNNQILKDNLNEYLESAIKIIEQREKEEQERIERERIRQQEIAAAWVKLNVPYISQNYSKVYNGCEAACLLMALKYRGYLSGKDLYTYASEMPKSDDPQTGFYLDIFSSEPREYAHWIAPEPLTNFGKNSSGYYNIVNTTGYSLSDLDNEVINGNPVIIYVTYNYASPYGWSNGVPKNLHVVLLTGYNKITQEQLITDPWTKSNGEKNSVVTKQVLEHLYNSIGKKSVVIR